MRSLPEIIAANSESTTKRIVPVAGCICTCCENSRCDCHTVPLGERCVCAFCRASRELRGEIIEAAA